MFLEFNLIAWGLFYVKMQNSKNISSKNARQLDKILFKILCFVLMTTMLSAFTELQRLRLCASGANVIKHFLSVIYGFS